MLHATGPVSPCGTGHGLPASLDEKFGCSLSKPLRAGAWCSSITTRRPWPRCLAPAQKRTAPGKIAERAAEPCMGEGSRGGTPGSSPLQHPSQSHPLPGIPMPSSGQRAPCEMGARLVLWVQIFAPKFLLGLWRGRAIPAVSPEALATWRGSAVVPSAALPCGSALPFPYLFSSP